MSSSHRPTQNKVDEETASEWHINATHERLEEEQAEDDEDYTRQHGFIASMERQRNAARAAAAIECEELDESPTSPDLNFEEQWKRLRADIDRRNRLPSLAIPRHNKCAHTI